MAAFDYRLVFANQLRLIITLLQKRKLLLADLSRPRHRRFWVREVLKRRRQQSQYHILVQELQLHDREYFFKYLRMSPERFEHLLKLVAPFIQKKKCRSREPISPAERLVITIRYLATGDSQQSQAFNFRIGKKTCVFGLIKAQFIWEQLFQLLWKSTAFDLLSSVCTVKICLHKPCLQYQILTRALPKFK